MARGRMITNLICKDKRVNSLSDDTCRLLFTWLITHADCEGRTYGDAAIVRATIFPRRNDISIEQVEGYLQELHGCRLIVRYVVDDEQYIFFPGFEKNQIGLRKNRESPSEIPAPAFQNDAHLLRSNSGATPEQLPVKLMEVNTIEVNLTESDGAIKALSSCFERETNILMHQPQKWTEALITMHTAGVTPDELAETIQDMRKPRGKNHEPLTVTGPWSCQNMAIAKHANNNGSSSMGMLGIDRSKYEQKQL